MKTILGILVLCGGFALAGCDQASSPFTCLPDGSVTWGVKANSKGDLRDTATAENCAKAKR